MLIWTLLGYDLYNIHDIHVFILFILHIVNFVVFRMPYRWSSQQKNLLVTSHSWDGKHPKRFHSILVFVDKSRFFKTNGVRRLGPMARWIDASNLFVSIKPNNMVYNLLKFISYAKGACRCSWINIQMIRSGCAPSQWFHVHQGGPNHRDHPVSDGLGPVNPSLEWTDTSAFEVK